MLRAIAQSVLEPLRFFFSVENGLQIPVWYCPYPHLGLPALITRRVSLWYEVFYLSDALTWRSIWLLGPYPSEELSPR